MRFVEKVWKANNLIWETLDTYDSVAVACSFGKDSMVVLHLALQVKPDIQVFSIMTPFKPKVTLQYANEMARRYQLRLKFFTQVGTHIERTNIAGIPALDATRLADPNECCQFYKVIPTKDAIRTFNLDAWITGLRRTEGKTRTDYDYIETRSGLLKINPILDFTELDVWRYLAINEIPVNPLYNEGYRSLGCEPCSKKEDDETDEERAGRWAGTEKQSGECGIHTQVLRYLDVDC